MALPEDFDKIYGSAATGGLTPISDVNYAKGWEFVGANPPTKNDFSYLQNLSDMKAQWLYNNNYGRLLNCQVFTQSGPYTPTPGTKTIIVEAVGAGGGGGGCAANTTSQASGGEGGGAGAYAISKFTSGFSGVTVNIGIGGAAGTAGGSPAPGNPNWGGDGGATTFGGLLSVSGGKGGKAGGSSLLVSIGSSPTDNSGTVTGANIYYRYGEPGEVAILARSNNNTGSISGRGGSSKFGYPGGRISIQGPGQAAQGHGAGGGGGLSVSAGSAQAGGAGADGMVIVWEYA